MSDQVRTDGNENVLASIRELTTDPKSAPRRRVVDTDDGKRLLLTSEYRVDRPSVRPRSGSVEPLVLTSASAVHPDPSTVANGSQRPAGGSAALPVRPGSDTAAARPLILEREAQAATQTEGGTEDDDLSDLSSGIDEAALRDMVAEIVREELQGALGERVTRNVRKLVRREISRAISVREFK